MDKTISNFKPKIDGFAINCGNGRHVMTLKNNKYTIYGEEYTYDELIKDIKKNYKNPEKIEKFIQKLEDCKDMKWLTPKVLSKLKDHKFWAVRKALVEYTNEFHEYLKNDSDWLVRKAVTEYINETERY